MDNDNILTLLKLMEKQLIRIENRINYIETKIDSISQKPNNHFRLSLQDFLQTIKSFSSIYYVISLKIINTGLRLALRPEINVKKLKVDSMQIGDQQGYHSVISMWKLLKIANDHWPSEAEKLNQEIILDTDIIANKKNEKPILSMDQQELTLPPLPNMEFLLECDKIKALQSWLTEATDLYTVSVASCKEHTDTVNRDIGVQCQKVRDKYTSLIKNLTNEMQSEIDELEAKKVSSASVDEALTKINYIKLVLQEKKHIIRHQQNNL